MPVPMQMVLVLLSLHQLTPKVEAVLHLNRVTAWQAERVATPRLVALRCLWQLSSPEAVATPRADERHRRNHRLDQHPSNS
jgi:hypothetical protein